MRMLKGQDVEIGQRDAFRRVVQHEQGGYLMVTEEIGHWIRQLQAKRGSTQDCEVLEGVAL